MKRILFTLFALVFSLSASTVDAKRTVLRMVDKDATPRTKALYANLWLIHERGTMFGHHDFPSYGIGWRGDEDRSDVKDVVGDHPALFFHV